MDRTRISELAEGMNNNVTKINSVIELDGKRFDATNGNFLGASTNAKTKQKKKTQQPARSVDGFLRQSVPTIPVKTAPRAHQSTHVHHSATPLAAHQPQHSETLMRGLVQTPTIKPERRPHAQSPTDLVKASPNVISVKPKLSIDKVDSGRVERASHASRSDKVVRFQAQSEQLGRATYASPSLPIQATPHEAVQSEAIHQSQPDMFERAIANASSHEQPAPKESRVHQARRGARQHLRMVSISAAILAAVLLGGFIAYQNKVDLELQLASARAGFAASMPGYHPSGYSARSLSYNPGTVTIGFRGPSNHQYTVVQKASNWDSETLLQNYVASSGQTYQAYAAAGRTIYIYGNGNATWVNGGVWYQVSTGSAHLSNGQIIDLATSI